MTGFTHYQPRTHLSISSLVAFARCPRKYFYSSGCRLGMPEHPALAFGSGIHAGLPLAFQGNLTGALTAFDHAFGTTVGDEKRNKVSAMKIFFNYFETHKNGRSIYVLEPPPSGVLKIEDSVSEWEVPFALDIGLSVPLVGRMDCLCHHRDTGEKWVLEWKTSSEMSSRFFDGFTINPQCIGYTLAAQAYGLPAVGCIVEGLQVSLTKNSCQSQPVFVQPHHIQDFVTWAHYIGTQLLACERQMEFPKDISACVPYPQFGSPGYQCDYQNLCLVPDWTALREMYQIKDDRPFKILPNGIPLTEKK